MRPGPCMVESDRALAFQEVLVSYTPRRRPWSHRDDLDKFMVAFVVIGLLVGFAFAVFR